MDKYTFYCSEEQTRNALELGAPIREVFYDVQSPEIAKQYNLLIIDSKLYCIPTSEQMINWLTEQEILLCINPTNSSSNFYWIRGVKMGEKYRWESHFEINKCKTTFNTRQKATLDAIDKALEYLSNNKDKKGE